MKRNHLQFDDVVWDYISQDQLRPSMTGVYTDYNDVKCATNGHILITNRVEQYTTVDKAQIIGEKGLINESFPNWAAVVDWEWRSRNHFMIPATESFVKYIEGLCKITETDFALRFSFDGKQVTMSSHFPKERDSKWNFTAELNCEQPEYTNGNVFVCGIQPKYLLTLLKTWVGLAPAMQMPMYFDTPYKSIVTGTDKFLALVMPVRL